MVSAIALLALVGTSLAALAGSGPAPKSNTTTDLVVNDSVTLAPGDAARLKAAHIKGTFLPVDSDNRCPPGVECIVAGEAVVVLEVAKIGNDVQTYKVSTTDGKLKIDTSTFVMDDLEPYGQATKGTPDYRLTAHFE